MAEQAAKPVEGQSAEEPGTGVKRRGKALSTIGLIGGVMVLEGVAIFLCMRFFGSSPDPLHGLEPVTTSNPAEEYREIEVTQLRVPNTQGPRTTLFSLQFVVVTHHNKEKDVAELVKAKKWTIDDTLSRVIREADPREMMEPGLETMRRKAKFELDRIFEGTRAKDAIEHVLIPECVPVPSGY